MKSDNVKIELLGIDGSEFPDAFVAFFPWLEHKQSNRNMRALLASTFLFIPTSVTKPTRDFN